MQQDYAHGSREHALTHTRHIIIAHAPSAITPTANPHERTLCRPMMNQITGSEPVPCMCLRSESRDRLRFESAALLRLSGLTTKVSIELVTDADCRARE